MTLTDSIDGYDASREVFAARYESLDAQTVHAAFQDLLPSGQDRMALDIGAGSGRDAAWLTRLGFDVVAVEPAHSLQADVAPPQTRTACGSRSWLGRPVGQVASEGLVQPTQMPSNLGGEGGQLRDLQLENGPIHDRRVQGAGDLVDVDAYGKELTPAFELQP